MIPEVITVAVRSQITAIGRLIIQFKIRGCSTRKTVAPAETAINVVVNEVFRDLDAFGRQIGRRELARQLRFDNRLEY